jgi:hypothetical protein
VVSVVGIGRGPRSDADIVLDGPGRGSMAVNGEVAETVVAREPLATAEANP